MFLSFHLPLRLDVDQEAADPIRTAEHEAEPEPGLDPDRLATTEIVIETAAIATVITEQGTALNRNTLVWSA